MLKLIKNITIVFIISFSIIFFFYFFTPENKFSYLKISDKKYEILSQAKSPKLILIGGSNLSFGIYSPKLEQILQMPVVNMGLHAGLGLEFMLRQSLPFVQKGDIVLVVPEYSLFLNNYYFGSETLAQYIIENKDEIYKLSINNLYTIIGNIFNSIQKRYDYIIEKTLKRDELFPISYSNIYNNLDFNYKGDFVGHYKYYKKEIKNTDYNNKYINYKSFIELKEIKETIEKKGAYMIFSYPSYSDSSYRINHKIIDQIVKKIETNSLNTISNYKNYIFSDEFFFNTDYHLNVKGVNKRTYLLANDIREFTYTVK